MPWAIDLISSICEELKKGDFLSLELTRSNFERFIILLLREIMCVEDKSIKEYRREILSDNDVNKGDILRDEKIDTFFNTRYMIPTLSIEDLAEELNLSVRQVNRILKEELKTSFHKKFTERRLMPGRKNLLRKDRTIEEIADKIGFSSSSGFYIAFKREFGMTPLEYKKLYKK